MRAHKVASLLCNFVLVQICHIQTAVVDDEFEFNLLPINLCSHVLAYNIFLFQQNSKSVDTT